MNRSARCGSAYSGRTPSKRRSREQCDRLAHVEMAPRRRASTSASASAAPDSRMKRSSDPPGSIPPLQPSDGRAPSICGGPRAGGYEQPEVSSRTTGSGCGLLARWCPSRQRGSAAPRCIGSGAGAVRPVAGGRRLVGPEIELQRTDATDRGSRRARSSSGTSSSGDSGGSSPVRLRRALYGLVFGRGGSGEPRCRGGLMRVALTVERPGIRSRRDRGRDDRSSRRRSSGEGTSTSSVSPLVIGAPPSPSGCRSPFGSFGLPARPLFEAWQGCGGLRSSERPGRSTWSTAPIIVVPPTHGPARARPIHDLAFLSYPEHYTRHGRAILQAGTRSRTPRRRGGHLPVAGDHRACVAAGFEAERLRLVPWGVRADARSAEAEGAFALALRDRTAVHPVLRHPGAPQEPAPRSRGVPRRSTEPISTSSSPDRRGGKKTSSDR